MPEQAGKSELLFWYARLPPCKSDPKPAVRDVFKCESLKECNSSISEAIELKAFIILDIFY